MKILKLSIKTERLFEAEGVKFLRACIVKEVDCKIKALKGISRKANEIIFP